MLPELSCSLLSNVVLMFSDTPRSLQGPSYVDPKAVSLEFTVQIPGTMSLLQESALESGLRSSPALSLTLLGLHVLICKMGLTVLPPEACCDDVC